VSKGKFLELGRGKLVPRPLQTKGKEFGELSERGDAKRPQSLDEESRRAENRAKECDSGYGNEWTGSGKRWN